MSEYKNSLTKSMTFLGEKDNTIFIGQQIVYPGNPMSSTLVNVSKSKMIELPVMEDSQMGMSLGLSMAGHFVISFYPRWDFLICATNQLVNHVDKIELMSNSQWKPNMIIRVGKGSDEPIDPGHQHKGNYLKQFTELCPNIKFWELKNPDAIESIYINSYEAGGINVIVEYPQLYN